LQAQGARGKRAGFVRVDAFQYELPEELIAQRPAERRGLARLMHLPASGGPPEHKSMEELPELLPRGALVVVNDTRVIPARLLGRKRDTGGRVEVFLVRQLEERDIEIEPGKVRRAPVWKALGKSSKALRFGADIDVPFRGSESEGTSAASPRRGQNQVGLVARLLGRSAEDGLLEVALWTPDASPVDEALLACGRVPLPPYIKREDDADDADRYQTVYARHDGAVAAPTAGLHLTNALLGRLAVGGGELASVTLHVGLGTFQPVMVDDLSDHPMHSERYVVPQATVDAIARARNRGAPVVAVGTTTVRALESASGAHTGETRLLIQPGHTWRVVDGLLTNFHLPRSTLLALVCAFGGTERVLAAYRTAVERGYRFYSYGDGMLLWRAR
jgi:S-adenosylmethionine:tRNA ribosyltransferase-isomerase